MGFAVAFVLFSTHALAQPANPSPAYLDASASIADRVADLLGQMTLAEKAGQLATIEVGRLSGPDDVEEVLAGAHVGSLFGSAGPLPPGISLAEWARGVNALQQYALDHSRLRIPLLYGVDAPHGFTVARGAEVFPHQLGLAATRSPALVRSISEATGRVARAAGVRWVFGPVADVARDVRWGRYYETFGEDPTRAGRMVASTVSGLQGIDPAAPNVAATPKHFIAYSQPRDGVDTAPVDVSDEALRSVFAPPFSAGIGAGARAVMSQHGRVNGEPTVASRALLTGLLRQELSFDGLTVSDWGDVENLFCGCQGTPFVHSDPWVPDYERAVAAALNAGLDVSMVPHRAVEFTAAVQSAVRDGLVAEATVDAAVARMLDLKFRLGLFEQPFVDEGPGPVRTADDVRLGRQAATSSLTLLRNAGGVVPLARRGPVLVVGPGANSLRRQYGGWTVGWQGVPPGTPPPPGTTVLQAMRRLLGADAVRTVANWKNAAQVRSAVRGTRAAIVVIAEEPYAEWVGDSPTASLETAQADLVRTIEETGVPTVLVLMAGRPLMIADLIRNASAFVMAYLPGSEGGTAVANVLFGASAARGKLPFTWPASIDDVPMALNERLDGVPATPLFPYGAGLSTVPG